MDVIIEKAERLRGAIRVPGDKSIAHRALILGALADGEQVVDGLPDSQDVRSTARCLRTLGCQVEEVGGLVVVRGEKWIHGQVLDAGNSGTTARLLPGLIAGRGLDCRIDGDESLRRRPMKRIAEPLMKMGADVRTRPGGVLPMHIRGGKLKGIVYRPEVASAQVKSAVLIAGLHADGATTVIEKVPTRDHTENLLSAMGAVVGRHNGEVRVAGGTGLQGIRMTIPGDVSSALFFVVAASLLCGSEIRIRGVGVNPTRTGAIRILEEMGAAIEFDSVSTRAGEPIADVTVRAASLGGVKIGGKIIPSLIDELPVLAVAATQAQGVTEVCGAGELRHKESDRIRTVAENLVRLGADIEELEYGFIVRGPCSLRGCAVRSFGDHRIAMAMAVAGLVAEGRTTIEGSEAVAVSYPRFFSDLWKIAK